MARGKTICKYLTAAALLLAMAASVGGCKRVAPDPQPAPLSAFLSGTTLNGTDLSGRTPEEAVQLLKEAAEQYTLKVTLDDVEFSMDAAQLGLTYNERTDLAAMLKEQDAQPSRLAFEEKQLYLTGDAEQLQAAMLKAKQDAQAAAEAAKATEPSSTGASENSEPS